MCLNIQYNFNKRIYTVKTLLSLPGEDLITLPGGGYLFFGVLEGALIKRGLSREGVNGHTHIHSKSEKEQQGTINKCTERNSCSCQV